MATTFRQFISNIATQLKQSGDDKDIKLPQIALWSAYFINKYRYTKGLKVDSGAYLSIFTDVPVIEPTESLNGNIIKGRKYFVLPASVLDYDADGGVSYISYVDFDETCSPSFTSVTFTRTSPEKAKRLYYSEYEKPTTKNPYWYRVSDKIYLLGIEKINIQYLEIGLKTTFNPFDAGQLDSNLDVGEEALADITAQVLNLGRFMMLMPSDIKNDGTDTTTPQSVPTTKITSVNQPLSTPEQITE